MFCPNEELYFQPFMCSDPAYKELEKKLICDTFLFKVLNKSNIQVPSKFMSRNSPQIMWPTPSSNSNNCGHSAAHYLSNNVLAAQCAYIAAQNHHDMPQKAIILH